MRLDIIRFAFAVTPCVLAKPLDLASEYVVKDSHQPHPHWTRLGRAASDHVIRLEIGLKAGRLDELEQQIYEVSNPAHERYGQWLSAADVDYYVRPNDDTLDAVTKWLAQHGIDLSLLEYSPAKDWISIDLPLGDVEQLLQAEYSLFENSYDGTQIVRTTAYSLPQHLHDDIDMIVPTNSFFGAAARKSLSNVDLGSRSITKENHSAGQIEPRTPVDVAAEAAVKSYCDAPPFTPDCLRALYGTINYFPRVPGLNKIGVCNYLGETNNRSDVRIFLEKYRPEAAYYADEFEIISVNGGLDQQKPATFLQRLNQQFAEGDLDAEAIISIAWPTPMTAYNTGGKNVPFHPDAYNQHNSNEPYLAWLKYMLSLPNEAIPQVISASYGDDEQTVPIKYAKRICQHFSYLAARGVSILHASADDGVGAAGTCHTNDGSHTRQFTAAFPASCPYVTAVGATASIPEQAWHKSGAGFSRYFPRPWWQDGAVTAYLAGINDSHSGLYNPAGRAYNDISAAGVGYASIWAGHGLRLSGTSAATPTAAAVLSLVNDALLAAGRPQLGFLNPWLYYYGAAGFNDIVNGSAKGCNTDGFSAMPGWDPPSGFGSPNFPALLSILGLSF